MALVVCSGIAHLSRARNRDDEPLAIYIAISKFITRARSLVQGQVWVGVVTVCQAPETLPLTRSYVIVPHYHC